LGVAEQLAHHPQALAPAIAANVSVLGIEPLIARRF
jgi:hypothetical protein